jgi:hypothetical protein
MENGYKKADVCREFGLVNSTIGQSEWPRSLRRRSAAERLLGSWVRIPGGGMEFFVSCTAFVLSGRGLCDGPIPRPEDSYQLCCVLECNQVKNKKPCTPTVNK